MLRDVVYGACMEHDFTTVNGSELREARVALGAKVKDVATAMDVDPATVWRWERPDRTHGELDARRYLDALEQIRGTR